MDIFGGWVWYAYSEDPMNWIRMRAEDASAIVEQNKRGEFPEALEEMAAPAAVAEPVYTNVVGQDDLTRFDRQGGGQNRKKKKKKRPQSGEGRSAQPVQQGAPSGAAPREGAPREGGSRDRNRNRNRNRPPNRNNPPQS
jgi:hypothetical protein